MEMESPEVHINLSTLYQQNISLSETWLKSSNISVSISSVYISSASLTKKKKFPLVPQHTNANTPLLIIWSFDQIEQYV